MYMHMYMCTCIQTHMYMYTYVCVRMLICVANLHAHKALAFKETPRSPRKMLLSEFSEAVALWENLHLAQGGIVVSFHACKSACI